MMIYPSHSPQKSGIGNRGGDLLRQILPNKANAKEWEYNMSLVTYTGDEFPQDSVLVKAAVILESYR